MFRTFAGAALLALAAGNAAANPEPLHVASISTSPGTPTLMTPNGDFVTVETSAMSVSQCVDVRLRSGVDGLALWFWQQCVAPASGGSPGPVHHFDAVLDPAGYVDVAAQLNYQRIVARVDLRTGVPAWSHVTYSGAVGANVLGLAVGPSGDLWLRSVSEGSTRIARYDAATGATLFDVPLAEAFSSQRQEWRLAVAPDATATTVYDASFESPRMRRVSASGATIWDRPIELLHPDARLVLDSQGAVIFGGKRAGYPHLPPFHLTKARASDGAIEWQLDTEAMGNPLVDAQDGIVVASMVQFCTTCRYRTVVRRYDAGGNLTWRREVAPVGSVALGLSTDPVSIALDAAGDVVLLGAGAPSRQDLASYVAKFRGSDGVPLWEKWTVIPGSTGGGSFHGLQTGPAGIGHSRSFQFEGTIAPGVDRYIEVPAARLSRESRFDTMGDGYATVPWLEADGTLMLASVDAGAIRYLRPVLPGGTGWTLDRMVDLDGDGVADLLWRRGDGAVAAWTMRNGVQAGGALLLGGGTGWSIAAAADFNGDGKADILWRHDDGTTAVWLMDGVRQIGGARLLPAGSGWTPKATPDLNGDGRADILWTHTDGRVAAWIMNGAAQVGGAVLLGAGTGWAPKLTGDFNGDGRADIVWQHTDGGVALWLMNGTANIGGARLQDAGTPWTARAVGDFDGDGRADLLWQHADGTMAYWLMNGAAKTGGATLFTATGAVELRMVADFNGDGRADILVQWPDGVARAWMLQGGDFYSNVMLGVEEGRTVVTMPSMARP